MSKLFPGGLWNDPFFAEIQRRQLAMRAALDADKEKRRAELREWMQTGRDLSPFPEKRKDMVELVSEEEADAAFLAAEAEIVGGGEEEGMDVGVFADRVQRLREGMGLTQRELGEKVGSGQSVVWRWETGKSRPRRRTLEKLAAVLGCSVEDLG